MIRGFPKFKMVVPQNGWFILESALPCTCIQIGSNCSHFSHSLNQSSVFSCAQRTRRLGRRDIRQRGIAFQHESQVYFHKQTHKERHPIIVQCDKQNALKHLTGNSVHGSDMAFRPFFLLDRRLVHAPWTDHGKPELWCTYPYKYIFCHCGLCPVRDEDSRPPIFLQLCRHSPQRKLKEQMSSRNQPCLRRM